MKKSLRKYWKLALTLAATGMMCDLCGGQMTSCIYDGMKNGNPVTLGSDATIKHNTIDGSVVFTFGA
jgi:hypothetical protein